MEFLVWHYSFGVGFYIARYKTSVTSIYHYFSLSLLLTHLFSPWKRLVIDEQVKGLNFQKKFEIASFNIVSRFIGAFVRLILFITGVVTIIVITLLGAVGFLLWFALPPLSYQIYDLYKKQPEQVVREILNKIGRGDDLVTSIFNSVAGEFVLRHLDLDLTKVKQIFETSSAFTLKSAVTFQEIISELLKLDPEFKGRLATHSVTIDDFTLAASWGDRRRTRETQIVMNPANETPGIGRSLLFGYTPTLDKYATDMGVKQNFSHHLIGREDTARRIERVLASNQSVFVSGETGVGKKTILYELARRAGEGLLGHDMAYVRVLEFDYTPIISGSADISQKKVLLSQVLLEAREAGNVLLVMRDIHRLTNAALEGIDMTDIFERHLETNKLKIVAILNSQDYERFVAPNMRLRKFFETVSVSAMSKKDAEIVVLDAAQEWERKSKQTITVVALKAILDGSEKYVSETPFPEKALELLDAVMTAHEGKSVIVLTDVRETLSEKTGIALMSLSEGEKTKLGNLEETLHKRIVSQDAAITLIAKTLRAKTSGVIQTNRPIGSFLFLGPTGVGKTETAKALAQVYFGSEKAMIRLNMAEFEGNEGLTRLIGSVAQNIPGELTTAIKNHPASLLLLDEIEKAPREILNLLLALLDEGQIQDAFGKPIICSHLFVIGTSNAGSEYIRSLINEGSDSSTLSEKIINHVITEKIFSPEFVNRFDGVVVYEPLSEKDLLAIGTQMAQLVTDTVLEKNIDVSFSDDALQKIVSEGFDPALGARPIRRIMELTIGDLLGRAILSGEVVSGDKIRIIPDGGKIGYVWEKL